MNLIFIAIITILAVLLITIFVKLISIKKENLAKIADLNYQIDEEKKINNRLFSEINDLKKADKSEEVKIILTQLERANKEKEAEIKLRNEAEKEVVLTIQKTEDLEKRMSDWKIAQDSAMQDAQKTIAEMIDILYQKISFDHSKTQELVERIFTQTTKIKSDDDLADNMSNHPTKPDKNINEVKKYNHLSELKNNLKKALSTTKLTAKKDYFIQEFFSDKFAKLFYCDIALFHDSQIYFFDLKFIDIFAHFKSSANTSKPDKVIISKLDKYCDYLSDPKYHKAITTALKSLMTDFQEGEIVMVVNDESDIEWMNKNNLSDKFEDANIKIATFSELIELIN
jgi:cell division protein FtsL